MKHHRTTKNQKALKRMKVRPVITIDKSELDKQIFDTVLKKLYDNSEKNTLHLENEIYNPMNIKLNISDSERIWEVMISSGWIMPVIGFGNSGKVELTKSGYQLMSQFGSYTQYLTSVANAQQPQTIILPIQIQDDDNASVPQITGTSEKDKAAHKSFRRSKYCR